MIPRQPKHFPRDEDALALHFMGHFFNCTLGDIVHTASPHDFWRRTLPTLAQSEPLVWHAITALGTTHWLFMGHEFATPSQIAASEAVLNQQYNQAITRLIPLMFYDPDSNPYIPLMLICCLLFVYIEFLRESRTEAFRHLVSGSRLLASLIDVSSISSPPGKSLREIAVIFGWIESGVTPFAYDRLLSNLVSFANPAKGDTEAASGPFASLSEVEDELADIDMEVHDNKWSAHRGGNWADLPLNHREMKCTSWEAVNNRFLVWERRFEKTLKVLGLENDDSYEVLNLRFQRHIWPLMTNNNKQLWNKDPKIKPEECHVIMDQVELLLSMTPARMRIFTVHAKFIPALIVVYGSCADTAMRRRVIALLRTRQRREIVWDSEEVAQFLEADLERCLAGQKTTEWPRIGPCADGKALLCYWPPDL